jgi:hypothetical protein
MWAIPMVYKVRNALLQRSLRVTSRLAGTLPLPLMSNILNRQVAQFLEIRSAANARHSALQAESRWPAVRASGAGVSERQIRLGIRTARALADELPAAAAEILLSRRLLRTRLLLASGHSNRSCRGRIFNVLFAPALFARCQT